MLNKLKYLFLTIFCASFIVSATNISAQMGAKITVADVDGMIEFYEWAFETDLTPAQRSQLKQIMEADFRRDGVKSRKDTDTVLNNFAVIKQRSAEARRENRRVFLNSFLPGLKSEERTNPEAKFLLDIYRDSHGGSDDFTALDAATGDVFDKRANATTTANGTANIYGKWVRGIGNTQVDSTGKTQYKFNETYTFEFLPDGTAKYTYDKDVLTMMQCKIKEAGTASGTVEVNGETLIINLGEMADSGTSSCETKDNFNRTQPAVNITKKFTVKRMEDYFRPDKPLILCFEGMADKDCFVRENS